MQTFTKALRIIIYSINNVLFSSESVLRLTFICDDERITKKGFKKTELSVMWYEEEIIF